MSLNTCNVANLLCALLLSNMTYGLAAPFLPKLLQDKGIESTSTGLILATYAVARIVASLIAGKIIDSMSHSKVLALGSGLMAISIGAFGFATDLQSNGSIITLCIVLRAL